MNKRTRTFLIVIALLVITDSYAGVADGLDQIMNPSEPAVQEPKVKPKPPHPAHKESNTAIAPQLKDENCIAGDCVNGQGTYTYPNGEKYVGEWKDDKRNGQGTNTYPNGTVGTGLWENDQFVQ